jgi:hypothetical protein
MSNMESEFEEIMSEVGKELLMDFRVRKLSLFPAL